MAEAITELLPTVGEKIDTLSFGELRIAARDWHDQAAYWKSQFERAKEREIKKDKKIETLEAEIRLWKQKLFGKKSESKKSPDKIEGEIIPKKEKKKRGQQAGAPGHKRREYDLEIIKENKELPEDERRCPICGALGVHKGLTHEADIVEIEVKGYKRKVSRPQYHKTCDCPETPAIISAPAPDRLIKGNNLGVSVWTYLLLLKFNFHIPLSRALKHLALYNVDLPIGTITDGFRRIQPLFKPILESIKNTSLQEHHWHADETRWSVFVSIEGKAGHRWYLWVYRSENCIYFQLEPSRGTKVPLDFFPDDIIGILSVDRYSAYKCLIKSIKGLVLAFCWAHVRRDFLDAFKKWPVLEKWTVAWMLEIRELYRLNDLRCEKEVETKDWVTADTQLRKQVELMKGKMDDELAMDSLHSESKKVLTSLSNHWEGLTVFLDNPHVPLDNNPAEQTVRGPTIGRNNYFGSGSSWSAKLASSLFSLFATLRLHGINPDEWLNSYLNACAAAGGKPPADISSFTPWDNRNQDKIEIKSSA
ncbi:MAG: IS66 family transposase [Planctomycetes bacterium]|nr:IS66 family transposase [Planctomycetota bacterium]